MDAADLQEGHGTASSPNKVSDLSPIPAGAIAIVVVINCSLSLLAK